MSNVAIIHVSEQLTSIAQYAIVGTVSSVMLFLAALLRRPAAAVAFCTVLGPKNMTFSV